MIIYIILLFLNLLKFLSHDNPAVKLIKNNISAICVHTPIDVASEGINDILFNKLKNSLGLLDFKKPIGK